MGIGWKIILVFVTAIVGLIIMEIKKSPHNQGSQDVAHKEPIQKIGDWMIVLALVAVAIICVVAVI